MIPYSGYITGSCEANMLISTSQGKLTERHFSQIDRFMAIWQAANPNAWFDSGTDGANLLPFRKQKTPTEAFWTSADVKSTKTFGYTYPEVLESDVKTAFDNHYKWATTEPCATSGPPDSMKIVDVSSAPVFKSQSSSNTAGGTTSFRVAAQPVELERVQVSMVSDSESAQPVSETSAEQKEIALQRSIRTDNDTEVASAAAAAVDESKTYRDWFIDTIVERYRPKLHKYRQLITN